MSEEMLDAGLALLDRQVVDIDGKLVGKVDDLELAIRRGGEIEVEAILMGPQALGPRLGGRVGGWIRRLGATLADAEEPIRVPMKHVKELGVRITLSIKVTDIERLLDVEQWLRDHVIRKIPGGRDASE